MDLNEALALLSNKCSDYHTTYTTIFSSMKKELDSPLKDYVEAIMNDPKEWIRSFPQKHKSPSALAKGKSAMLSLLKEDKMMGSLGAEFCNEAVQTLEQGWKDHHKAILEERSFVEEKTIRLQSSNGKKSGRNQKDDDVDHVDDDDVRESSEPDDEDNLSDTERAMAARPHDYASLACKAKYLEKKVEELNEKCALFQVAQQNVADLKLLVLSLVKEEDVERYNMLLSRW